MGQCDQIFVMGHQCDEGQIKFVMGHCGGLGKQSIIFDGALNKMALPLNLLGPMMFFPSFTIISPPHLSLYKP
jgi:hypothetical protein